jgi:hypothetical protein
MSDKTSGLKLYSLGIVTKNKIPDDPWVEVDPIESMSMDLGDISASKEVKATTANQSGVKKTASMKKTSSLKAKWIPFGHSNRDTAPDVVAGETVIIFSYADTQDFYWTTIFREPELRRLERVRYLWSNQPSGQAPATPETSYYALVDTLNKKVAFHTSDNNGEACQYDIDIDTTAGLFVVKDSLGNTLELDSKAGKLTATTENEVIVNTKRFTLNASESVEINSAQMTINAPLTTKGGVAMSGGSGMVLQGDMQMEGNIGMKGDVRVEGNLTASNVSEG